MADIKRYLDYAGLQEFWSLVKNYYADTVSKANTALQNFEVKYGGVVEDIVTIANNKVSVDLGAYAKKADITAVLKFKGVKDYQKDLPPVAEANVGDVYIVKYRGESGTTPWNVEFVCVDSPDKHWEEFGGALDLSNYYTKAEVDVKYDELAAAIDEEFERAQANETALSNAITEDRASIAKEIEDRKAADAANLYEAKHYTDVFVDDLDERLENEITRATAAEKKEADDRKAADDAEAANREHADAVEAIDRKAGDKEVYDAILSIQNFRIKKMFDEVLVGTPADLRNALVDASTNDGVITLTQDVVLDALVEVPADKKVAIDLGGHTLTAPQGVRAFNIRQGADVIIADGKIVTEYDHASDPDWKQYAPAIVAYGVASTIESDQTTNVVFEDVNLVATDMLNGTLLQTNGTQKNINITFNSGKFEGAFYLPAKGCITINGGDFYTIDSDIFSVKQGCPLYINGGNFTLKATEAYDPKWAHLNSGAMSSTGAIILVEACNYGGQGNPEVHYLGGTFHVENIANKDIQVFPLLVVNYKDNHIDPKSVMGKTYHEANIAGDHISDGEIEPTDGWVTFTTDESAIGTDNFVTKVVC